VAVVRPARRVPAAAVLPEAALQAADRKVVARRAAVEPQAARPDQWAAAPTVVAELPAAERRVAGQQAAVEPQAAARPDQWAAVPTVVAELPAAERRVVARLAVADRPARKAAVRAVAEVAAAVR
jgi:hypothetical protein